MESLTLAEWLRNELKYGRFPQRMPAHRRVYESIRRAIASHHLTPGTRLPSTRSLADILELSRNTLLAAFEQLLDEGYVVSRIGSGTHVAASLLDGMIEEGKSNAADESATAAETPSVYRFAVWLRPVRLAVPVMKYSRSRPAKMTSPPLPPSFGGAC